MRVAMFSLCLMAFSITASAETVQDLPPVDASAETEMVTTPSPIPQPPAMATGTSCDFTPAATCCDGCCDTYRCCCCGHPCCYMPGIHKRKKNGKLKWCRVWTTGDMYPHYAYQPVHHGYYYFRPYNYINVEEHKAIIVRLGGDAQHPYSLAMFDEVYEDYYALSPPRLEPTIEELIPTADMLPLIEDLMD